MPRPEVTDHTECQEEYTRGNRSQHDQRDIDDAVHFLTAAAVLTSRKVVFVVLAHFRRETGNVVPPAGQNLAHDRVDALAHTQVLQANGLQRLGL